MFRIEKCWRPLITAFSDTATHSGTKLCFVLFCSFRNQAAESIQAEVNQYCIIICAPDHTSELDINPNLITCYFLLCNKSMIQAHISFIWPLN